MLQHVQVRVLRFKSTTYDYDTDTSNEIKGVFFFQFNFAVSSCNSTLSAKDAILQSPNYPNNYPNNSRCYTLIQAPEGNVVFLNITHFALESDGDQQGVCKNDYDSLSLYDGQDDSAPLLGKYCGSLIPESFESSGRYLYAVFRSDQRTEFSGYSAQISFKGKLSCPS